jgi:hypothetical protein
VDEQQQTSVSYHWIIMLGGGGRVQKMCLHESPACHSPYDTLYRRYTKKLRSFMVTKIDFLKTTISLHIILQKGDSLLDFILS